MPLSRFTLFPYVSLVLVSSFLPASLNAAAATTAVRLDAEPYFTPAAIAAVKISPDGKHIAVLRRVDDKQHALTIHDEGAPARVVRPSNKTFLNFWWKGSDLVLVLVELQTGNELALPAGSRLFATYDLKTGNLTQFETFEYSMTFISTLPEEPDDMLFVQASGVTIVGAADAFHGLARFNVRTGVVKTVEKTGLGELLVNRSGVAVATALTGIRATTIQWREAPGSPWKTIKRDAIKGTAVMSPFAVAADGHRLYAIDNTDESKSRVILFDPATESSEVVSGTEGTLPNIEVWGIKRTPGALVYNVDGPVRKIYLDPKAEAFDKELKDLLPPDVAATFVDSSEDETRVIMMTRSGRDNGEYFMYDRKTNRVSGLGAIFAGLNRNQMPERRPFNFTSSDGLRITGFLTVPNGATKPPLIVYMNGYGSDIAPTRSFAERDVQYMASKGFAVAEVNHRGINGLGRAFHDAASFKLDTDVPRDITEAVSYLDAQGLIDPKRVAVWGESYLSLVAYQVASRGVAQALVTFDSPSAPAQESPINFSFYLADSEGDARTAGGGISATNAYMRRLIPNAHTATLNAASFHYYHTSATSSAYNSENISETRSVVAALKKRKVTAEIHTAEEYAKVLGFRTAKDWISWQIEAKAFESAMDFLKTTFAVP